MLQGGRYTGTGTCSITLTQAFYDTDYFVFLAYENTTENDADSVTFATMGVYPKTTTSFTTRFKVSQKTKVWYAVGRWKET